MLINLNWVGRVMYWIYV